MDKLKMKTLDKVSENVDRVALLFPNCVTEAIKGYNEDGSPILERAIDFDMLRQELSGVVVEGNEERYQFSWPDKKKSILIANAPINKTLRPVFADEKEPSGADSKGNPYISTGSVGKDGTAGGMDSQNLYIEGDNLDVLKLLQETYMGKVKMIYIDPPYNTGNDFVYEDDFAMSTDEYMDVSNQTDDDGNRLFQNNESNGRFHTDWLNMIYPRLKLAKDLLTDDGVIFISIDDNEVHNLRKLCDEIFGSGNFISQIVWEKVHTRKNSAKYFSNSHEHLLCYAKIKVVDDKDVGWKRNLLPREDTSAYKNLDNDPKGVWKLDPITAHNYYDADYIIEKPNGVKLSRPQNRYWVYSKTSWETKVKENSVVWGDGESYPMVKRYLSEVQDGLVPTTIFSRIFAGDSSLGNKDLAMTLELGAIFTYPKPILLVKRLMQIGINKEDIILDFFSGSATTAHAVMQLNAEDGGNRKFIMVQLPEVTDEKSEAHKAGYKNICEIGKERIRRAGKKITEQFSNAQCKKNDTQKTLLDDIDQTSTILHPTSSIQGNPTSSIDTGFRVLKLDSTNMKEVYYRAEQYSQNLLDKYESNIKEERVPQDLLFQIMLDMGVLLSSKIETRQFVMQNSKCIMLDKNDHTSTILHPTSTIYIVGEYTNNIQPNLIACFDENLSNELVTAIAKLKPLFAVFRDSSFATDSVATNFEQIFTTYSPTTERKVI